MLLLSIFTLFFLLICFKVYAADEVFVSMDGEDLAGCGSKSMPCKSLQFVLQEIKSKNLTVYLDGGSLKPFVYMQNDTLVYNGISLTIKMMTGSAYKPTIKGNKPYSQDIFIVKFYSLPNFEMDSVIFQQIKLVSFETSGKDINSNIGRISISNCISEVTFQGAQFLIIGDAPDIPFAITFHNLTIKGGVKYLYGGNMNQLNLSIRDSWFTATAILFNARQGILNVENTIFMGAFQYDNVTNSVAGKEIRMENVDFRRSRSSSARLYFSSINKTILSQCYFGESYAGSISAGNCDNLTISNCTFAEISAAPYVIHMTYITILIITNCHFQQLSVFVIQVDNCNQVLLHNNVFMDLQSSYTIVLSVKETKSVTVNNSYFVRCSAAIEISNVRLMQVENSWLIENCLKSKGNSPISCINSNLQVVSSTFKQNCARKGGAINAVNCSVEIFSSDFLENNADSAGTFFFNSNSKAFFSNVSIVSPLENIPLFATVIESNSNRISFEKVNINIQASSESVDMLMFNTDIKSSFNYSCPVGRKVTTVGNAIWKCLSCEKAKYSFNSGYVFFHNSTNSFTRDTDCKHCPVGGICNNGIISRGNFWGYLDKDEVKFIPCLKNYCCNNKESMCTSISTCNKNREGQICGKCKPDHYIGFFTNNCFPNKNCTHLKEFWLVYVLCVFTVFILLAYFKDILAKIKRIFRCNVKQKLEHQLDNSLKEPLLEDEHKKYRSEDKKVEFQKAEVKGNRGTAQGVLKILINFYQLNMLINVPMHDDSKQKSNIISDVIQTVFTMKLTIRKLSSTLCPMKNLTILTKLFVKELLFVIMLFILVICLYAIFIVFQLLKKIKQSRSDSAIVNITDHISHFQTDSSIGTNINVDLIGVEQIEENKTRSFLSFDVRCKVCLLQVFLIGYTNIATYTIQMINCVKINDSYYLYVYADVTCFTTWQYVVIIFLVCWVIPFSLSLYFSTILLRSNSITIHKFVCCMIFPPITAYLYLKNKCTSFPVRPSQQEESMHILSVLEDPFRNIKGLKTLWDPVILVRRIIIIALTILLNNPIARLCSLFPIFVIYLHHHCQLLPYRIKLLNDLESFCLLNLCILTCVNLFRAFIYVYNLTADQFPLNIISDVFNIYEYILMLLPLIALVLYIIWGISLKLLLKVQELCTKKSV